MDESIYTPGAGHLPPVLVGRDDLIARWEAAIKGVGRVGRARALDAVLIGQRGVGKTVTLTALTQKAKSFGFLNISLQAVAGHDGLIAALLDQVKDRADAQEGPWRRAGRVFARLEGLSIGVAGISGSISLARQNAREHPVDAARLAEALSALAYEIRKDNPDGGLLITVDEMQVAAAADLALLAAVLQRLNVDYPKSTVLFAGTGLLNTPDVLQKAGVTHPDRLFTIIEIPRHLTEDEALYAVEEPARRVGVEWDPEAAWSVVQDSNCFPAHLQLFADLAWTNADGPLRIEIPDAVAARQLGKQAIEERTLIPRWRGLSPRKREILAALATFGGVASRSQLSKALGKTPQKTSWLIDELVKDGDIFSPSRNLLALAVPAFADVILQRYDQELEFATKKLLSLDELRANAGADE